MDINGIATLQDYKSSIETSFKKMEKLFNEAEGADQSQQNLAIGSINSELKTIKCNIGLIHLEITNLNEKSNINKWNEIISEINAKNDSYKRRLEQLKSGHISSNMDDPLNINQKIDLSKMSSKQVMTRGDKFLEEDRNAISRMKKVAYNDLDTMKEVNKELLIQHEKLENAEVELKEIDNSLNRAGKKIKTMAKMYVTDKLIMCIIICILLVVIGIIIMVVFFDSGDDQNYKQDTFQN